MYIDSKSIAKLNELSADLERNQYILSEQIRTVQDRRGHNVIKVNRGGKDVNLTEKILWEEVYQAGINSEAGRILAKEYPEIFEQQQLVDKLVEETNLFTAKAFGFLFSEMSMNKLLALTNAIVDYRLRERNLFRKIYAYLRRKIREQI